jgi:ABC-type transporter Mla subunit MlaD
MNMQAVAELISRTETIIGVVGFLTIWALASAVSLRIGAGKLIRALRDATNLIGTTADAADFSANYESISAKIAANPILGARWREYGASLVFPQDDTRPIRATTRAESWFDAGLLRVRGIRVDVRYHAALPNLLVGAGLLFTFLGLAAALSTAGGIVAGDQANRNGALQVLLNTASFKFITSLVGLLLSIIYALARKGYLRAIESALDAFLTTLELRVPLLTPAALQQEANDLLKRQSVQLETFSTDLAINLGAAFDNAFNDRLGEHIAPLTSAMQRLADGIGTRNEDALKTMLESFVRQLQGGTGERMNDVAMQLGDLSTRLEGLQTSLGGAAERMAEAADTMANRMGKGADDALARITDQVGSLAEGLKSIIDQTSAAGANAGRDMSERIEAAARIFEQAARQISEQMSSAALASQRSINENAENGAKQLSEQLGSVVNQLQQMADHNRSAGSDLLVKLSGRIGEAADKFEASASRAASELGTTAGSVGKAWEQEAQQAVSRMADASQALAGRIAEINDATTGMVARITDLQRATRDAATPLAAGANDMKLAGQAVKSALEPLSQVAQVIGRSLDQISGVAQRVEATHASAGQLIESLATAAQRFEGVDQDLSKTLAALQGGLQSFTRLMQEFVTSTDSNLAKAATQLASLVKSLQDSLDDFSPSRADGRPFRTNA